jgi:TPR repeat protein
LRAQALQTQTYIAFSFSWPSQFKAVKACELTGDLARALALYNMAADAGHVGAQSELAEAYKKAKFCLVIDLAVALTLHQKAAQGGEHYAQRILGFACENRGLHEKIGQMTDEDEALKW